MAVWIFFSVAPPAQNSPELKIHTTNVAQARDTLSTYYSVRKSNWLQFQLKLQTFQLCSDCVNFQTAQKSACKDSVFNQKCALSGFLRCRSAMLCCFYIMFLNVPHKTFEIILCNVFVWTKSSLQNCAIMAPSVGWEKNYSGPMA